MGYCSSSRSPGTSEYSVHVAWHCGLLHAVFALHAIGLIFLILAGCGAETGTTAREPSFRDQLAAVKAGTSDQIHVSQPITDAEIAEVAGADSLKSLIIDTADATISGSTLDRLHSLPALEIFWFRGRGINDAELGKLATIKTLKVLNVPQGEFSDAGLAALKDLPHLVQLRFGSPHITDAGIASLVEFPSLLRLHLIDVAITGEGLQSLARLENLESLYIDGGKFGDADIDALFRARPKLHVHFNQQHHDRDPHKHDH